MLTQIKTALHRSQDTLIQDALGAVSLVVILVVALHLPGLACPLSACVLVPGALASCPKPDACD